jgi:hypothetical protein
VFSLPYIREHINAGVVFKALGLEEDDFSTYIGISGNTKIEKLIRFIIRDSYFIADQESAIKYIGQYSIHPIKDDTDREKYANQIINDDLFPHLGVISSQKEKAMFAAYMVRKLLLTHIGLRSEDDRDNYANKRVEMAGVLCCELFRTLFKRYIKALTSQLVKRKQNPSIMAVIQRVNTITIGLRQAFSTGNWGVHKSYVRMGVSQVLSRLTFGATLSHLRRIVIPIGKEGKNAKIRQIHPSQIMVCCPCECFDPNTPILMWDGSTKLASEIVKGDKLIGDNGLPTVVKSTCSGITMMYKISQKNSDNIDYVVTGNHILTLKITDHKKTTMKNENFEFTWFDKKRLCYMNMVFESFNSLKEFSDRIPSDDVLDIELKYYTMLPNMVKKKLVGFKCSRVQWKKQDVPMNPYIFGLLINSNLNITELTLKCNEYYPGITRESIEKFQNSFECTGKYIPNDYIANDANVRLKVLAGMVDANGYSHWEKGYGTIVICTNQNNSRLVKDICKMVASLGFFYHVKNEKIYVCGKNLSDIPANVFPRNAAPLENLSNTQIQVSKKGVGPFVGWQLDGNGRFLLDDCTVVHNTPEGQSVGIVLNMALTAKVSNRTQSIIVEDIMLRPSRK